MTLHNTTLVAMSRREARARYIRDFLGTVLREIPEYHTTEAARDTLQDLEEMMYGLWKDVGLVHRRESQ